MAWRVPKTNWTASDYVTIDDIGRIIHNLEEMRQMIITSLDDDIAYANWPTMTVPTVYTTIILCTLMTNIEYATYLCAEEFYDYSQRIDFFPEYRTYKENGNTPDYVRLNEIEGALANMYEVLSNAT